MAAAKIELPIIEKGATYRHTLVWNDTLGMPINLTGATARMQVRSSVISPGVPHTRGDEPVFNINRQNFNTRSPHPWG